MPRKQSPDNLRGRRVEFTYEGRRIRGTVITRIRGTRWQVASSQLPSKSGRYDWRRTTVDASRLTFIAEPIRKARTPLERAIDRACGLD